MTPKKVIRSEPCIPLDKAQALVATGKSVLEKARLVVNRLEETGQDVVALKESLKAGAVNERLALRMLSHALETSPKIKEKE